MFKKTASEKLAKAQARMQDYTHGRVSSRHDKKGFAELNDRIKSLKNIILKERKIKLGKTLEEMGMSRIYINIHFSDLNLNDSEFNILSEI